VKKLKQDEKFGLAINRANNWLDDEVAIIVKNATTETEKAKKIFEYLRDNFTCSNTNNYFITTGLKDVLKNKNGSVGDINMLLIAMLRNQKISVEPIILSTRSHGITSEYYPLMERYNYVIAAVYIDGKTFYLDASEPRLAFNKLPLKVYNGHARQISEEALPVYFRADSIKESSNTLVFIWDKEKGGIEGSFTNNAGYYQSLGIRDIVAKTTL
jgi:hypothetical protein